MSTRKFWPLDYDPEGEIYENVAWDLPGFRRTHRKAQVKVKLTSRTSRLRQSLDQAC